MRLLQLSVSCCRGKPQTLAYFFVDSVWLHFDKQPLMRDTIKFFHKVCVYAINFITVIQSFCPLIQLQCNRSSWEKPILKLAEQTVSFHVFQNVDAYQCLHGFTEDASKTNWSIISRKCILTFFEDHCNNGQQPVTRDNWVCLSIPFFLFGLRFLRILRTFS